MVVFISASLDAPVSGWLSAHGIDNIVDHAWWAKAVKFGGTFWVTLGVAVMVGVWHRLKWRGGIFIALCGVVSGVNGIVKWIVGRTRPTKGVAPFELHPFRYGWAGAFDQKNLGFPSGHACLAFAMAAALAILLPRWRWAFYGCATLVAIERVAENAHYVSDAVGAAAIGVMGVWIVAWICERVVTCGRGGGGQARTIADE
jgi:membrane-associated phospholipid phosphatase